ncbi:hypothetical protein SSZBM1_143 [Synechococcus phage S-SZBM1]|uniref:Uncharacterized protein n=1 Tax=Synechococcus phage S-SZBM1 TaxID=2926475 RepID=A0AC61TSN4_9CAUD|nr:hypothetical protein PP650_gp133 [Synechococcus phage S-SZBM1]UNH61260.1 hypothetical protein SSZBM1_143 [Synechococcus phage S-SZBM1]
MALSQSVLDSINEAEASLRNALAFAARQEKPFVCRSIADMVHQLDQLKSMDELIDKLENRKEGDKGFFGPMFGGE